MRSLFMPRALPCVQVCVLFVIAVAASFTIAGQRLRGGYVLQSSLADQHANNVINPDAVAVQASTASAKCAASPRPRLTACPALGAWRVACSVVSVFVSCVPRRVQNSVHASAHQAASSSACRSRSNCDHCWPSPFVISNRSLPQPLASSPQVLATHPHQQLLTSITGRVSLHSRVISLSITCVLAACITLSSWVNRPSAAALGNSHAHSIHEGSCQQRRRRLHCVSVDHSAPEMRAVFSDCNLVPHLVNLQTIRVRICIRYPSVNSCSRGGAVCSEQIPANANKSRSAISF